MEQALAIQREAESRLQAINKAISKSGSDVQLYYSGAVVLITGGSGYMGKQLLEKLFRSCEIRKAYILLRPRKGKSVEDRLNEILKDPAYEGLFLSQPDFKQCIVPVEGDVAQLRLGMSVENWKDIAENVTMIYHVAATVKFNEAIKTAVLTNVRGTREILRLAQDCRQLKSFVYISTAYSNVTRSRKDTPIAERFYPAPFSPEHLIHIVETFPDARLQDLTTKMIDGWPNTYSFTKAVAEELLRWAGADLPICIVRPAIVIGAYNEPIPGWIDRRCMYGSNGIGLGCLMGILHVIICKDDVPVNLIPVDYVNNAIIVAAKATGKRWSDGEKEIAIYNVTCDKSFVWANCVKNFNTILSKMPSPKIIGDCFAVKVSSNLTYYIHIMFLHYIPAYIIDFLSVLVGRKPWLTKIYNRIHNLSQVTKYFTLNKWLFDDKNTQQLFHSLSNQDKIIFNFDKTTLDVPKLMTLWAIGIRKFMINDDLRGTEFGRKKQMFFKMLNLAILFFYFCVLLIVFNTICVISNCFSN